MKLLRSALMSGLTFGYAWLTPSAAWAQPRTAALLLGTGYLSGSAVHEGTLNLSLRAEASLQVLSSAGVTGFFQAIKLFPRYDGDVGGQSEALGYDLFGGGLGVSLGLGGGRPRVRLAAGVGAYHAVARFEHRSAGSMVLGLHAGLAVAVKRWHTGELILGARMASFPEVDARSLWFVLPLEVGLRFW